MRMQRTTVKMLVTADGLCALGDQVKVGDVYYVDLDSERELRWGHMDRESTEIRKSVWADASANGGHAGWMPIELFDFPEVLA